MSTPFEAISCQASRNHTVRDFILMARRMDGEALDYLDSAFLRHYVQDWTMSPIYREMEEVARYIEKTKKEPIKVTFILSWVHRICKRFRNNALDCTENKPLIVIAGQRSYEIYEKSI